MAHQNLLPHMHIHTVATEACVLLVFAILHAQVMSLSVFLCGIYESQLNISVSGSGSLNGNGTCPFVDCFL